MSFAPTLSERMSQRNEAVMKNASEGLIHNPVLQSLPKAKLFKPVSEFSQVTDFLPGPVVDEPRMPRSETFYNTSYSALGLTRGHFRNLCQRLAEELPDLMHKVGADAIAVRGTSGVSVAFGLRMLSDIPTIVVKKEGENSHGASVTAVGDDWANVARYLIVDDFVASGATVHAIRQRMGRAECVGVLSYANASVATSVLRREDHLALGQLPYFRFR